MAIAVENALYLVLSKKGHVKIDVKKSSVVRQLAELTRLRDSLSESRSKNRISSRPQQAYPGRSSNTRSDDGRRWPHPDAKRVLDGLPLPPLEHHYRIPKVVSANHLPFLRYKKPQPPFLSHMIREKTRERLKRVDRTQALEKSVTFAEDEDQWDRILWKVNRVSRNDKGVQWVWAARESLSHVKKVHFRNAMNRVQAAQRMFAVVQEQRKLLVKAKVDRRDRRHQKYKTRKRQRAVGTRDEDASSIADDSCQPAISVAAG
ncbi:MAG: hypothetical protein L6R37_001270 [Teloschistes peruensis]|nr:MAG: hypothetical protein L6R37_001270 [Teloschistes peruensis]